MLILDIETREGMVSHMIFSQPNCPIDSILFILHHDPSNSNEGSLTSVDIAEYRVDDNDAEFFNSRMPSRGSSGHSSSRRRRSRFYDH
ncbi:hypothetical protein IFM89_038308 [Coptis chinensis]|uniref:Uncharacterized protein n=1 Tax=Coptis chinensis TaxID=261450 RepID=A0A835I3U6_9MAGN|nr:hypothetical protein IFM89_038308 [Coptis chinensis]